MRTLACGKASCGARPEENQSWEFHALLGSDGVPPGTWLHPLEPHILSQVGRKDVKVCDSASSPPHTPPWSEPGPYSQAGPRMMTALVRVSLYGCTLSSEGVSGKYLFTLWDPGQEGSPGSNRIFIIFVVTQTRVNVISCNTKCPLFPGAIWTDSRTPPDDTRH